jgi:signal transduction histidine kinase
MTTLNLLAPLGKLTHDLRTLKIAIMKKQTLLLFLLIKSSLLFGQQNATQHQIDSLTRLLATSDVVQVKIDALFGLGQLNLFENPGKAEQYLNDGLLLTRKINDKQQIAGYLVTLGYFYGNTGQPAKGIELLHESLPFFEEIKGDKSMAYAFLANNYEAQGDLKNAVDFARKSYQGYEKWLKNNLPVQPMGYPAGPMRMGQLFEKTGQLDSAMHYAQQAYQRILEKPMDGMEFFYCQICNLLGNVYSRQNQPAEAIRYYRLAINKAIETKSLPSIHESQLGLAKFYAKTNLPDSAVFYATQAYEGAKKIKNYDFMQNAAGLLRSVYEKKGVFEKALYFNDLAVAARDSVSGADKVREVQNLTFREERRQDKMRQDAEVAQAAFINRVKVFSLLAVLAGLLLVAFILYRNNRNKQKVNAILQEQKEKVEHTLTQLKTTQAQLIQSEKLASLGELTAGIAHEIQNPLNFVNNFAEVSAEMLSEMEEELHKGDTDEAKAIAADLKINLEKINHHGKRAASIVKGMLEHSRTSTGKKALSDMNTLADEYLRLSYHGFLAKDRNFNALMESHFDASLPKIEVIPQDIGRVLLNLINNAFYAVNEKAKQGIEGYQPTVTVSTRKLDATIEIKVQDNGSGIPEAIKEKIFQPFFTTKPTGQGTGLGLSLAYDIVVKGHGATLEVESIADQGTVFSVMLPA